MSSDKQVRSTEAVAALRSRQSLQKGLGSKTAGGAAVVTLSTWFVRLGYVAVYVMLARGLSVEDYGVVAAMTVVVNLFGGLTTLGLQSALIQQAEEPSREEMDLAWTLDCLLTRSFSALAIGMAAFPIARFFDEPQLAFIICVLALEPLIGAFESSSIVVLSRKLEYRQRTWLLMSNGLGFIVGTAGFFLYSGSLWAPVIGALLGRIARTTTSYVLYPITPRFRWRSDFLRQHARFSGGVFFVSVFEKARGQSDKIVIGRLLGVSDLGAYQFVSRLSSQLIRDITKPLNQVLFPALARLNAHGDTSRTNEAVLMVLEVHVLFGAALAGFFSVHAAAVLELLVGERWVPYAYVLQTMGFISLLQAANAALYPVLRGRGYSLLEASMQGGGLLLFVLVAASMPAAFGMRGALTALAVAEVTQFALALVFLLRVLNLEYGRLFRTMALALMLGFVPFWAANSGFQLLLNEDMGLGTKAATAFIGAILLAFGATLLGKYGLMPSVERLMGALRNRLSRKRRAS